jgi:hypothetical protein
MTTNDTSTVLAQLRTVVDLTNTEIQSPRPCFTAHAGCV